jgi:hypothetical protein
MQKEKSIHGLEIDAEFKRFIPPLSAEERKQLKENLLKDGCRDALVVWGDTVIDGHNRYEICVKHGIPFEISGIEFSGREEAIAWICANQLGRRNITEETRRYLIGKRYEMEKAIGMHRNLDGLNQHKKKEVSCQNDNRPDFYETATRTCERLGREYRVSPTTVLRYGTYAQALDTLQKEVPELYERIVSGEVKMTQEKVIEFSQFPSSEIKRIEAEVPKEHSELIRYMSTRGLIPKKTTNRAQLAQMQIGAIKDMPQYDPDAEILSLALTIPSWVSSINRVRTTAKIDEISDKARNKISKVLSDLKAVADTMLAAIEENE